MAGGSKVTKLIFWFLGGGLAILILGNVVLLISNSKVSDRKTAVYLSGEKFYLDVAKTSSSQQKGLGGRSSIPQDGGMLFLFTRADRYPFWMKGMILSIDIFWLDGDKIVFIKGNAEPPPTGTPDAELEVFTPPVPADKVIEVMAGTAERLGIETGQRVNILLP